MFGRLVGIFWNRRKDRKRYTLQLMVQATDPEGTGILLTSEDVSERGIRLRSNGIPVSRVVGKRDEVPLEIRFESDVPPVKVLAQVVWTTSMSGERSLSGWQFTTFHGNARRRLRGYLERMTPEGGDDGQAESAPETAREAGH